MSHVNVSIIIVNYNTTSDLKECLHSIYTTIRDITFEIIVIDNNSVDKVVLKRLLRDEFPQVHCIFNSSNMGFAAGCNIGIRKSRGKFLLFLNPDVILMNGAVETMYYFIKDRKDIGGIGPLIYNEENEVVYYCGRTFPDILTEVFKYSGLAKLFPNNRFFSRYFMSYWDHKSLKEVDAVQGSCMLIPRQVINKVGPMDERFFLFAEDIELCYRIKRSGYYILMNPEAIVMHKGARAAVGREGITYLLGFDSMYKFFSLFYSNVTGITYRILMFLLFSMKYLVGLLSNSTIANMRLNVIKWSIGMISIQKKVRK